MFVFKLCLSLLCGHWLYHSIDGLLPSLLFYTSMCSSISSSGLFTVLAWVVVILVAVWCHNPWQIRMGDTIDKPWKYHPLFPETHPPRVNNSWVLTCYSVWTLGSALQWKVSQKHCEDCISSTGAAMAEGVEWSSSNLKVGSPIPSVPNKSACRSVLEQDAEPRIVPHRTTKCC